MTNATVDGADLVSAGLSGAKLTGVDLEEDERGEKSLTGARRGGRKLTDAEVRGGISIELLFPQDEP